MIRSPTESPQESLISIILRLLVAAYFIEAGLVLVVAPWTPIWERNFFAQTQPWIGWAMSNAFVRGGVTGVGVVTAIAGLRDLTGAILRRPAAPVETPPPPQVP